MNVVLLALAFTQVDARIVNAANDPNTFWYDDSSLPQVFQSNERLFRKGYNLAGRLDKTGSPNNESPWFHTGGTDGMDVTVRRFVWLPPGKKIAMKFANGTTPVKPIRPGQLTWTYPEGSVVGEVISDFEIRARIKGIDNWETFAISRGKPPALYKRPDNCIQCHEDVGRHAFTITREREWYGYVRGSDGIFTLHPFDGHAVHNGHDIGMPFKFSDKTRHLFQWSE